MFRYFWRRAIQYTAAIFLALLNTLGFAAQSDKQSVDGILNRAWLDNFNEITIKLPEEITFNDKTKVRFQVVDTDKKSYEIRSVDPAQGMGAGRSDTAVISLSSALPDIKSVYFVVFDEKTRYFVMVRNVLDNDEFIYKNDDLGFTYRPTGTEFKLWAPLALGISVRIYDYYNNATDKFSQKQPLFKLENGVWKGFVEGDMKGKYYLYEITQRYDGIIKTVLVADPYSRGAAVNSSRSMIFDMADVNKSVPGWDIDSYVTLKQNTDAIINELHIRDYTISPTSGVEPLLRGKYLGLTEYNTQNSSGLLTGLGNLLDLGVTHVQILPVYDYGTGDEAEMNFCYTWYNWGYDPVLYNSPEGSYARDPNGISRMLEYKTMIQALHSNRIGVIFDAVYNHTFQTGLKDFSIFDKIVPNYFYRVDNEGKYINGSGCGNDVATERPMVRKFILDSVKYWVREYHIDGFRFDLMGLMDKETIVQVHSLVKSINPNAIIYGEGWNIPTGIEASQRMIQANVYNTGVGAFNDGIRNCLVGNILVNDSTGYVQGSDTPRLLDKLKKQVQCTITGGGDDDAIPVFSPNESINYAGCHDNLCVWDKIKASMPKENDANTAKRAMLALGVVLTSQGVPLFGEGDEFGRTKQGDDNSFNSNEPFVNPIDWELKTKNKNMYDFVKGLIALRSAHPAFRMSSAEMIKNSMKFFTSPDKDSIIAFALINNANGDSWKTIIVAYNNTLSEYSLNVVGKWTVVVYGDKAGTEQVDIFMNNIKIPPLGMTVVHGNDEIESFEYQLIPKLNINKEMEEMMELNKKRMSILTIINMSIGFMGIQFGWGLQMANMSSIYEYLGANPDQIPILWLAAPLTGLIVQPIIGHMSDNTWCKLGRRHPYFLVGAILASLALFGMPYSGSLIMAAGFLWVLDASVNISMEPFRAFVADMLPYDQRTVGYSIQTLFVSIGAVTASAFPWILENVFHLHAEKVATAAPAFFHGLFADKLPYIIKFSFHFGAVVFIVCVLWTIFTVKEIPPQDMNAFKEQKKKSGSAGKFFKEICVDILHMPETMRKLAWVQFFTWMGFFLMWIYFGVTVARLFGPVGSPAYLEGLEWAGLCFAMYNVVCFIYSFLMPFIAAKIGRKGTHIFSMVLGAIAMAAVILVGHMESIVALKTFVMVLMIGIGIAWGSTLTMPYAILSSHIPQEKMGLYMGVFNFFITLPQIVASIGFGYIMANFLGNNSALGVACGGVSWLVAAVLMCRVKDSDPTKAA